MRIVIDLQGAQNGSRYRGIGRYTLALTKGILRNNSGHEIILALNGLFADTIEPIRSIFEGLIPQENIRIWASPGPVGYLDSNNSWRRQVAEKLREAFLSSLNPDIVLISSVFEGGGDDVVTSIGRFETNIPTAVILYDLIPLLNSEAYLADVTVEKWYKEKLEYLLKADLCLAISESSRQEGINYLQLPVDKVFNISTASDEKFHKTAIPTDVRKAICKRFNIARPFVMYSGASDPRKNHFRLINSYANLPKNTRQSHQLVLAGGMPQDHVLAFKQHAQSKGLAEDEMIITGHIDDEVMIGLYNLCKCFIFPSWHEGFGLPALEAMACGAAVIGSNTSSVPEVIGYPDALFDPFNEASITEKLNQVLTDTSFRERLIKHGLEQAKTFSWDITAKKTLATFDYFSKTAQLSTITPTLEKSEYASNKALITSLIDSVTRIQSPQPNTNCLIDLASSISESFPIEKKARKLFVDISELVQRDSGTGIQRVVRSIISELLKNNLDNYQVEFIYATTKEPYRYAQRFVQKFKGYPNPLLNDEIVEPHLGDIFLGLDFQDNIISSQSAWLQKMRARGVKIYFIVYDLLPILLKEYFGPAVYENYSIWLNTVSNSDGAICISQAVASELEEWLKFNTLSLNKPFHIGWFHLGADVSASHPSHGLPIDATSILDKLKIRPSFLLVGTIEPRKGQAQSLAAFVDLWNQGVDVNLVIIGKQGWSVESLINDIKGNPELGNRLFWLNGVSDEYLEKVYAASTCLIAASEGEGFGLPLIEAAQNKLPIIARDIPVFREVAGIHAYYFSGLKANDLAKAINDWLELNKAGRAPQSKLIPWLTWKQSTQSLLNIILDNKWHKQWIPDGVRRYWGADHRLFSQVGEKKDQSIRTTKKEGYLIYGPFISLAARQYHVVIQGTADTNELAGARMDVAANQGKLIFGNSLLKKADEDGNLITLPITLDTPCTDLEVRVWVSANSNLTISMIEIQPWDGSHESIPHNKPMKLTK
jgi:glycosyltransferase involved in cell wall biosynthesis